MTRRLFILTLLSLPTLSYAFFCPTNFGQINYGNTIEQVTQLCGQPSKIETKEIEAEGPQEWSYYIPQVVTDQARRPMPGTLKTQMTFDSTGRAINISVNGIGVGSTTICGGKMIQIGDTSDSIKAACGDPSFINKQNGSANALGAKPANKKITTMYYDSNPPVQLIFVDGILTENRQ